MGNVFFRMTDVCKNYFVGGETLEVLKFINLNIDKGEYLSVLGPSGSGKKHTDEHYRVSRPGNKRRIHIKWKID